MLKHKVEISRDKRHIVWAFSSFIILHLKKNSNYDPLICHKNTLHFKKSKKIVLFFKKLHLRCVTGLSIRLWKVFQAFLSVLNNMTDWVQICEKQQADFSENSSKRYTRATFCTEYHFFCPSSFSGYQVLTPFPFVHIGKKWFS